MECTKDHRYLELFKRAPFDQSGSGRHHCAGCAYEKGKEQGLKKSEKLNLNLDNLPESQAGTVRHKSPHYTYALGYLHGVQASYK